MRAGETVREMGRKGEIVCVCVCSRIARENSVPSSVLPCRCMCRYRWDDTSAVCADSATAIYGIFGLPPLLPSLLLISHSSPPFLFFSLSLFYYITHTHTHTFFLPAPSTFPFILRMSVSDKVDEHTYLLLLSTTLVGARSHPPFTPISVAMACWDE